MTVQSPLVGYNTNVRHKGKLYHIQTEDSGIHHPHVITHVFADGGRIIASRKTEYAQHLGAQDLPGIVKRLMQEQHRAMFVELRDCAYDDDPEARGVASSSVVAGAPAPVGPPAASAAGEGRAARASSVERIDPVSQLDRTEPAGPAGKSRGSSASGVHGEQAAPVVIAAGRADASAVFALQGTSRQPAPRELSVDALDRAAEALLRASVLGRIRLHADGLRRMSGRYQQTISARPRTLLKAHGHAAPTEAALRGNSLDEAILQYLSDDTGEVER
jgi:hypothetical protein